MLDRGVGRVDDGVVLDDVRCISFSGLDFGIIFDYNHHVKNARFWNH